MEIDPGKNQESVSLDYISKMYSQNGDELTPEIIEDILDLNNPIGILRERIETVYEKLN
jgi:hypothetical protein